MRRNPQVFPTKILLATDGSEDAELATRIAADLSTRAGSELHVVHVREPLPRYSYSGVTPDVYSYGVNEKREEGRKLLDEQVERITESGLQIHRAHLVAAPSVDEILDLAEEIDADLIAVGSRGPGPINRIRLGSVSTKVVRAAREPVLVYSYRRT
jgi:nucleotide-binding universal stress UspA family protein